MKSLFKVILLIAVVLLLVSCNANVIQQDDRVVTVSFSQVQSESLKTLSSVVNHIAKEDLYWRYTAVKKDKGAESGKTDSAALSDSKTVCGTEATPVAGLDNLFVFSYGKWDFTLYAYTTAEASSAKGENYIYSGTLTTTLASSSPVTITIGVSPVSTPFSGEGETGTIAFSGITNVGSNTLRYKFTSDGTWVTTSVSETVSRTPGPHTIYIGIYNGGTEVAYETVTLMVYRGLVTRITGDVNAVQVNPQ